MFWSIRLETNARLGVIQPKNNFKVSNAVLDLQSMSGNGVVSVWVLLGGNKTLLANLSHHASQVQIDAAFGKGEPVEFYLQAPFAATVYLSGYYIIDDETLSEHSFGSERPDPAMHQLGNQFPSFFSSDRNIVPRMLKNEYVNLHNIQATTESSQAKRQSLKRSLNDDSINYSSPPPKIQSPLDDSYTKVVDPGRRTLQDGVIIEDISKGTGKEVQANSTVKMQYKVAPVSSTVLSQAFEIEIGLKKQTTLSCWKIGIPGMHVGGVRRITSPSKKAYGSKGIPPFINGDTDVIFEVEIISCK